MSNCVSGFLRMSYGSVLLWQQRYVMYFRFCEWRHICP